MLDALLILGGGILLYFGAEWFVGGASALARPRAPTSRWSTAARRR